MHIRLINVNKRVCLCIFLLGCLFCRLLYSHAARPLHRNEKRQRRERRSRLWPRSAASVRPASPRRQSPYFWEDGPVIGLMHFAPLSCNWTLGQRVKKSCQSLHWDRIWGGKVGKMDGISLCFDSDTEAAPFFLPLLVMSIDHFPNNICE